MARAASGGWHPRSTWRQGGPVLNRHTIAAQPCAAAHSGGGSYQTPSDCCGGRLIPARRDRVAPLQRNCARGAAGKVPVGPARYARYAVGPDVRRGLRPRLHEPRAQTGCLSRCASFSHDVDTLISGAQRERKAVRLAIVFPGVRPHSLVGPSISIPIFEGRAVAGRPGSWRESQTTGQRPSFFQKTGHRAWKGWVTTP